ncbi:dimethyl sulfoxide reductase anchor subunit family protein [Trueperella bialowiezensis]|uniref:DMSO reductase anchor subunit n=1 Tax=Trueperella bialowiezensis TaxID=312285 RepID=A0A3S5EW37_9ACTO|nr:DmsC/YnfH family molybdoenzyme membrane anchor subunit [Trueperella bialowiezensis]VEI13547.1 DMSO reductase anchor subunit [Trueperella bialowiezensis]
MNLHELPMIIFTVVSQMAVGMFVLLGIIDLWVSSKTDDATADRLVTPIVYVIGPVLVAAMISSMFHMNDVTNTLNVIRNWKTSWLSREILAVSGFAGLGALYAVMQWFRWGSRRLRQLVALATAAVGLVLVLCESMIYASVETIPAWHTWVLPLQFFMTAVMLGAAAVSASVAVMTLIRKHYEDAPKPKVGPKLQVWLDRLGFTENVRAINARPTPKEWAFSVKIIRGSAVTAALAAVVILISYVVHIQNLAVHPEPAAASSVAVFSGGFFLARLILLGIGSVAVGFVAYRMADVDALERPIPLVFTVVTGMIMLIAAEFMGRSLHYDSMFLVGIG